MPEHREDESRIQIREPERNFQVCSQEAPLESFSAAHDANSSLSSTAHDASLRELSIEVPSTVNATTSNTFADQRGLLPHDGNDADDRSQYTDTLACWAQNFGTTTDIGPSNDTRQSAIHILWSFVNQVVLRLKNFLLRLYDHTWSQSTQTKSVPEQDATTFTENIEHLSTASSAPSELIEEPYLTTRNSNCPVQEEVQAREERPVQDGHLENASSSQSHADQEENGLQEAAARDAPMDEENASAIFVLAHGANASFGANSTTGLIAIRASSITSGTNATIGDHDTDDTTNDTGANRHQNSYTRRLLILVSGENSPIHIPLLYDATMSMAWPVLYCVRQRENDEGFTIDSLHVLGMPFHMSSSMFSPDPDDVPDAAKARAYVQELDRVDQELRVRMKYFGMSDIAVHGAKSDVQNSECVMGCGACFEPYPVEDRPAWFTEGRGLPDETVVVLPCPGFHTMHACCLVEWLASKAPNKWTCPYCRAPLGRRNSEALQKFETLVALREHVRQKEREAGCRCDAPACLPSYSDEDKNQACMIKLMPCRHEVHLDCLYTGMRVESAHAYTYLGSDASEDEDEEAEETWQGDSFAASMESSLHTSAEPNRASVLSDRRGSTGKWVTCPTCRKDAWAHFPQYGQSRRSRCAAIHRSVS